MKHIIVTGGSGRLGYAVIQDLLEHGYQVASVDQKQPKSPQCPFMTADLNDFEQVRSMLTCTDAIIHLAAIPSPMLQQNHMTFANNTVSTFNVLEAAYELNIKKTVIGSSESIYGFCYAKMPFSPHYVPVDENHPLLPQECYGLSKIVNEETAAMFCRSSNRQIVSLRFACIVASEEYRRLIDRNRQPEDMKRNLWSYIDIKDAAAACRLALEVDGLGAVALNVTADDTIVDIKSAELLMKYCPDATVIDGPLSDYQALFSNRRAKQLLQWQPAYSWRRQI